MFTDSGLKSVAIRQSAIRLRQIGRASAAAHSVRAKKVRQTMSNNATVTAADRLGLTLFFALTAHAMVILGVGFSIEKPPKQPPPDRTLEIMVVQNPKTAKKPEKADFLAQTNQQGGGEEEKKVKPTTEFNPPVQQPVPATQQQPLPPQPPAPVQDKPAKNVISKPQPAKKKMQVRPKEHPPEPQKTEKPTAAQLVASANQEIKRLTAELDRKTKAYAKRPRHKRLTASTQEYKYASYLNAWRRKVERIGNLNYPDEARRRKLHGSLLLHVSLRPDGTVKEIHVKRSSGYKLLDDAAIRIVRLSAPFAPFPAEIREETDIIDIYRTWQFLSNNKLFSK